MKLPPQLLEKILGRFDSLIAEGQDILRTAPTIPAQYGYNPMMRRDYKQSDEWQKPDWQRVVEWRHKAAILLSQVFPKDHVHYSSVEAYGTLAAQVGQLEWGISTLKAAKNDLEEGFLDILFSKMEAEIAADYMGQAENLLSEGQAGKFDYVPAAVLAGAVLEKGLRTLCTSQQILIPTATSKGEPKTLNPMIDDLKKAGVFNELKAKQLRAWADIRNKAAHGQFDQFGKADVEQMIQGITNFLAEYLA